MQPSQGAYRADPTWQIDRIEYVHERWGVNDSILDYQVVRREGEDYSLNGVHLRAELVTSLVASLADLHASQSTLLALSSLDDYPSWRMELVGRDGRRLLVYSSSTANSGAAPWNVLQNDRLYAQYTGAIATPMADLFHASTDDPAAASALRIRGSEQVGFATAGMPPQLTEGFEGLLLVSQSFHYMVDAASGTIRAQVEGRNPAGGFGNQVAGEITALNEALLIGVDGATSRCAVDRLETADPTLGAWSMECDVGLLAVGARFRLPLQLTVSSSDGRELIIEGALVGVWGSEKAPVVLPPPDDLSAILRVDASAARMLDDYPGRVPSPSLGLHAPPLGRNRHSIRPSRGA